MYISSTYISSYGTSRRLGLSDTKVNVPAGSQLNAVLGTESIGRMEIECRRSTCENAPEEC